MMIEAQTKFIRHYDKTIEELCEKYASSPELVGSTLPNSNSHYLNVK
jgi:hypothetical protein